MYRHGRWFFFKGPKPTFERWTYWEKFDFVAVFWGMFAIGGSGLMLWFPEFFGLFLPGWAFNVATIVHSDEALLATGFIFSVHFFNTHGRPEKFPMDFVIFNGQIGKEEMIEERGDQWKRYEEAGNHRAVCLQTHERCSLGLPVQGIRIYCRPNRSWTDGADASCFPEQVEGTNNHTIAYNACMSKGDANWHPPFSVLVIRALILKC